jgi:tRNA(fMet)-specific endonuclease VapC
VRYLLDTDTCVAIIRQRRGPLVDRLFAQPVGDVGVSAITAAELAYGVQKSRDPARNAQALERFLIPLALAPFDEAAARAYGAVRADLEAAGRTIGAMDMLIGAHAIALGACLLTGNAREFSRIRGLQVDSWMPDGATGR